MAATAANFRPPVKVQQKLIEYYHHCNYLFASRYNIRGQLLEIDRGYMREVDFTKEQEKAKRANRAGDTTKFQNIVVPVVLPQVEAAVTYQTSVFLQGYPIFGVVSDPSNSEAALQMDTIIGEQQTKGGWVAEYQKAFRNGFKYNLLATEVDWKQEVTFAVESSELTTDAKLKEIIWSGNQVKNLDLYNTFFDPRVPPSKVSTRGEFVGYNELMGRVAFIQFFNSLPDAFNLYAALHSNIGQSFNGSRAGGEYYFPEINPGALIRPDSMATNVWATFGGLRESSRSTRERFLSGMYQVSHMYAKIIPADFDITGVPGVNIPQNWKLTVVNGSVIVAVERLTNAHGYLPILMAQPYDDGLGYQTKSLAVNVMPIQEITTAFANSSIASRRRAIADRLLYDPSRISTAAINNDNPSSRIAVKPSAFGTEISAAVHQLPFRDDIFQINASEVQQYLGMANLITGSNPARQGQFVKGNKTRTEYVDIQSNSNGRDQTVAMSLEASLFVPTKEIIKANILQFQGGVSLYNREVQAPVTVKPDTLRNAMLVFKISDGLTPGEKLMDGESLAVAFQTMQAVPQLQQGYNMPQLFSYLMKSRGARLQPFEKPPEQLAYEQAMAQWQQVMTMLAQPLAGIKDITKEMIDQIMQQLPPQPLPEQFGWNPKEGTQQPNTTSILQQVTQTMGVTGGENE
jgi:hypothetical protein